MLGGFNSETKGLGVPVTSSRNQSHKAPVHTSEWTTDGRISNKKEILGLQAFLDFYFKVHVKKTSELIIFDLVSINVLLDRIPELHHISKK